MEVFPVFPFFLLVSLALRKEGLFPCIRGSQATPLDAKRGQGGGSEYSGLRQHSPCIYAFEGVVKIQASLCVKRGLYIHIRANPYPFHLPTPKGFEGPPLYAKPGLCIFLLLGKDDATHYARARIPKKFEEFIKFFNFIKFQLISTRTHVFLLGKEGPGEKKEKARSSWNFRSKFPLVF